MSQTPEPPAHLLVFDQYKDMSVMLTPNEKNVQHVCWCIIIIKHCLFGGRFPRSVFVLIFPHLSFLGEIFLHALCSHLILKRLPFGLILLPLFFVSFIMATAQNVWFSQLSNERPIGKRGPPSTVNKFGF